MNLSHESPATSFSRYLDDSVRQLIPRNLLPFEISEMRAFWKRSPQGLPEKNRRARVEEAEGEIREDRRSRRLDLIITLIRQ